MSNETQEETPQVTNDIQVLEKMNSMLVSDTKNVELARVNSPVEKVEQKLSDFINDAFIATNKDFEFNEKLKDEILKRLPGFTDNQMIALFSNTNVNLNDKISKIIAPTFQLMTATKNAEIVETARAKQTGNQVIVNTGTSVTPSDLGDSKEDTRDYMQGLNIFSSLFNSASLKDIDDATPTEGNNTP